MSPLAWECSWIDNNLSRYDSIEHADMVKRNIEKRYYRNALIFKLRNLRSTVRLLNRRVK